MPVKNGSKTAYTIYLEDGFEKLADYAGEELSPGERKLCIVSDSNVWKLYGEAVTGLLAKVF